MTTIAVYLFFAGALAGYRSSKYWPDAVRSIYWLKGLWWNCVCLLSGTILLLIDRGWSTGLLLALCIYMALLSGLIFFVNCSRPIRLGVCIAFHVICVIGLIFKF